LGRGRNRASQDVLVCTRVAAGAWLRHEINEATESMLAWATELADVPALGPERARSLQVVVEQARRIADAAQRLEHVEALAQRP
jgi:hypothetical protein